MCCPYTWAFCGDMFGEPSAKLSNKIPKIAHLKQRYRLVWMAGMCNLVPKRIYLFKLLNDAAVGAFLPRQAFEWIYDTKPKK